MAKFEAFTTETIDGIEQKVPKAVPRPILGDITADGTSVNLGTCCKCKYNVFKQVVNDCIYCDN